MSFSKILFIIGDVVIGIAIILLIVTSVAQPSASNVTGLKTQIVNMDLSVSNDYTPPPDYHKPPPTSGDGGSPWHPF